MFDKPVLSRHPVDIGQRSEAAIISELVRRGYEVLVPFGSNHRYDLVVHHEGQWLRVQCKTGRLRNGCIHWSTRSVRCNTRATVTAPYDGDADLFMVFCPETDGIYVIPVHEATKGAASLRIDPPANGQAKGIRWAADYELPA